MRFAPMTGRGGAMRIAALALSLTSAQAAGAEPLAERLVTCLACHGEKGASEMPDTPSLGGQPSPFLLNQMYLFREKQRIAEPMNEQMAGFTDDDLQAAADELAKLPPPAPSEPADAGRMERAAAISAKHRCGFCHNPDLAGHDHIPRLAGQREDYLVKAMTEYKAGTRTGYDPAMVEISKALSDAEIAEISYFLARRR